MILVVLRLIGVAIASIDACLDHLVGWVDNKVADGLNLEFVEGRTR